MTISVLSHFGGFLSFTRMTISIVTFLGFSQFHRETQDYNQKDYIIKSRNSMPIMSCHGDLGSCACRSAVGCWSSRWHILDSSLWAITVLFLVIWTSEKFVCAVWHINCKRTELCRCSWICEFNMLQPKINKHILFFVQFYKNKKELLLLWQISQ